ncbi:SH3 domain-containing protein [Drosera capensis]
MEAIRKQASRLREQVAKQQQALLKKLGHFGNDGLNPDEEELHCHQQVGDLYKSTTAAKHFQKDIIRRAEGFISISSKQMVIVRRFAQDCCQYGTANQSSTLPLPEVASQIGSCRGSMEKEREALHRIISDQVSTPLRALVTDSQLEDARLLVRHYDRLRQEVEAQGTEVARQRSKQGDGSAVENSIELHLAEAKLDELKSRMKAVRKEATFAMSSVEAQQQEKTFQQLLLMVGAEKSYHQSVLSLLEKLHSEITQDEQLTTPTSDSHSVRSDWSVQVTDRGADSNTSRSTPHGLGDKDDTFFIAKEPGSVLTTQFNEQLEELLFLFQGDKM